ncbi:MAG: catechol 2,3-dioxygenase-like lactoylglutathione lyase family enzyme [Paracoccaceae bacterium]|jgi:catechol 2,3-dioxygenase-like lactoylglutathione lyase family enzyme
MFKSICPIFPSNDFERTIDFYRFLGFSLAHQYDEEGYLILTRDKIELHFFRSLNVDPKTSDHGAYVRVQNANILSDEFAQKDLPQEGIPSVGRAEDKPWGLCEFAILDPDGNLLRVGHILD